MAIGAGTLALVAAALPIVIAPVATPAGRAAAQTPPVSTYCDTTDDGAANGGGTPTTLTVVAVDVDTNAPIPEFSYLVNLDNTSEASDPDPVRHPTLHQMASSSPVVAAGDETTPTFTVPDGCRYLVSVRAPDYKLWGQHVRLVPGAGDSTITVELLADPLPLSNIVVHVFEDIGPTDGAPSFPNDTGLAGFHIVVKDTVGEVVIDFDGSPLCADTGNFCVTDANGDVTITGIPYGKYELFAIPPDGTDWVQTSTFEGTKSVDAWLEEGSDGHGAVGEFLVEPGVLTAYWFGFVRPQGFPTPAPGPAGGTITGRAVNYFVGPPFETSAPQTNEPVKFPYVALNDTGGDDRVVFVGQGDANGNFSIPNVPPSSYTLTLWDANQDYIIGFYTIDIDAGETVALGNRGVFRWFGWVSGFVYLDNGRARDGTVITAANSIVQHNTGAGETFARNGIRDCYDNPADGTPAIDPDPFDFGRCETGLVGEEVMIKFRDGSIKTATVTNSDGFYEMPEVRGPLNRFTVAEVGFGRRARTGHAVHQEFNFDPATPANPPWNPYLSTRVPGDIGGDLLLSELTIEGRRSWIDWGKDNYVLSNPDENGGIAGAVLYATTRNEFSPALALQEDYEPGIPDVPLRLWSTAGTPTNQADDFLVSEIAADHWIHPTAADNNGCTYRDTIGNAISPDPNQIASRCVEVPLNGNESRDGAWDGGFAFEDDCSANVAALIDPVTGLPQGPVLGDADDDGNGIKNRDEPGPLYDEALFTAPCGHVRAGDFVVEVEVPDFYQLVKEEDQNTDEGSSLVPAITPPPCVGALHLVDDPRNPAHGTSTPLCDRKLVTLSRGQNAAAEFYLFTECEACAVENAETDQRWNTQESVPLPGRYMGLMEDDVSVQQDPNSPAYGEKRGVPNVPIGIYDFTGRHLTTIHTDENGYYEVLLPSSYTALCPIPGGVCPGMYVMRLNDPGEPAHPNPDFRADYLTEPIVFDTWPGKMTPTDTPVDPINTNICRVAPQTPEILQIDRVSAPNSGPATVVITGTSLEHGAAGAPTVTLTNAAGGVTTLPPGTLIPSNPNLNPPVFEDRLTVTVPGALPAGRYQLAVTADGLTSRSGLTFHVLGTGYNPPVVIVNPVTDVLLTPIQDAIDTAAVGSLIDIRPGTYRENVILHKQVTLQGHGPGGVVGHPRPEPPDAQPVPPNDPPFLHIPGSVIDARFFLGSAGVQANWDATLTGPASPFGGPATVPNGAAITVVAAAGEFTPAAGPLIDGLGITAARGFGGGGVYAHAQAVGLVVSNNILESNTGLHGGAIAAGLPDMSGGDADANNDELWIHHNRIVANGGSFLAGGIGLFAGTGSYEIDNNDICGNYSLEYGGGISHFGLSPGGHIHDNLIYYNEAFDEGGGIMVAGEIRAGGPAQGTGSGAVMIERNTIEFNLSNDDGGGIRLLRPLHDRIDIVNNFITDNAATDHGGGVALDDASNVFLVNNTVAFNASTATAEDADRGLPCTPTNTPPLPAPPVGRLTCPHAAGLTTELHSSTFTPPDASLFSDPVMFNNIFWQNEMFFWTTGGLVSAGFRDLEVVFGNPGQCLDPRESMLNVAYGPGNASCTNTHATNSVGVDPLFVTPLAPDLLAAPHRFNLDFIEVTLKRGEDVPGGIGTFFVDLSNYHILPTSPAINAGVAVDPTGTGATAPAVDVDRQTRPQGGAFDIGADEVAGTAAAPEALFLSLNVPCVGTALPACANEDILRDNGTGTPRFALQFDGSDVMPAAAALLADLDAFEVISPTEILISFDIRLPRATFAGLPATGPNAAPAQIEDNDILKFTATSLGSTTAGTWSFYFDGSDVGLGPAPNPLNPNSVEDIDAVEILPNGVLLISTLNNAAVPGFNFNDEDLAAFAPTSTGTNTAGTWQMYFDGSADGQGGALGENPEDVDGAALTDFGSNIHLSTDTDFATDGVTGADEDVFTFVPESLGLPTEGTFLPALLFDGSAALGIPALIQLLADVDGIDLVN